MLDRPVHHARARVIRVDNHGSAAYLYLAFFATKKTVRAFDLYEPHQSVGQQGTWLRDRLRTVGYRVLEIARLSRSKCQERKEKMQEKYRELVRLTRQVRNQAQRFSEEIHSGVKRAVNRKQQAVLRGMKQELDAMIPLVNQVLRQTTARMFRGVTDTPGKIVSLFEPTAEIIRKGKANKPREFGKMVKIQEAENQIIIHYEVYRQRPHDTKLLLPALTVHQQRLGRAPELAAGDAGFTPCRTSSPHTPWA